MTGQPLLHLKTSDTVSILNRWLASHAASSVGMQAT